MTGERAVRVAVLSASPRRGACERLARVVADGARAHADVVGLSLRDFEVRGCDGCEACLATGRCRLEALEGAGGRAGFVDLLGEIDACDGLVLVAPVYFSGPPSCLKAVYDRMQVLWARRYRLGLSPALPLSARRPLELFVVGGGGDPFGYEPLVTCTRSAMRMADYELSGVHDCIGYPGAGSDDVERAARRAAELFAERVVPFVRDHRPANGPGPTVGAPGMPDSEPLYEGGCHGRFPAC